MTDQATATAGKPTQESSRPLRIIIIGAGIGGLTLGIVLRRNGHDVHIYEQSRFARELGAAVHMAPNAHGLFKTLGIDLAATGANVVKYIREWAPSGEIIREINAEKANSIWQHSWMLAHRVRIHDALKEKALAAGAAGQPVTLHLASTVVSVNPDTATIILKDGTTAAGDVVIGADGVHSKTRQLIPSGEDSKLFGSGKSAFRFMIRREDALNDDSTRVLAEKDGVFSVVIGSDRRIVMYPTSNNTLLNFLAIHPDSESEAGEDWNTSSNRESLLKIYKSFAPQFQAILCKADPDSLKLWKLWDMKNLTAWNHSRLALIGDAAHPFLPHQGQGAAQAMEDAVALGTVLEKGLTADEVPERLKLYNDIRYERASKVQEFTRLAGLDVQDGKLDTIEYAKFNFGHDEFDNSAQKLREWKWQGISKTAFRMPTAFGPDPSLVSPQSTSTTLASFQSVAVRFKTSRTFIKNILPQDSTGFAFQAPGTVAIGSFVQTTFKNVDWLAGGSYNTLSLYVHGVTYNRPGSQKVSGVFCPILFEDLTHTVVRDREVYGLPAVYAEVNSEHTTKAYSVTARSNGIKWATIVLNGLSLGDSQATQTTQGAILPDDAVDSGLLAWRSAPSLGSKEDSFAVRVHFNKEDPALKVQQTWTTTDVSINIGLEGQKIPSITSQFVNRLSGIPIYQVLEAKVVTGTGAPSFSHVEQIV